MRSREPLLTKNWFRKGDLDINRVKIVLANNDPAEFAKIFLHDAMKKWAIVSPHRSGISFACQKTGLVWSYTVVSRLYFR